MAADAFAARSYCAGRGRITRGQKRALQERGARYLIEASQTPPDWRAIFGRDAPLIVEIGSGHGEATAHIAAQNPAIDYAAFETYKPGVGALINKLATRGIDNVRIVNDDAARYLPLMFAPRSLDGAHIFFPDPWPKRRHRKRRLVGENFVLTLANMLKTKGVVRAATDDESYAEQIKNIFAASEHFTRRESPNEQTPQTRFAARAAAAARGAAYLTYLRA